MLAATESGVHIVTVMCCTQLMKTALLENLFGYFAHLDPCPILLLQPKEEAAEQFSKERISPLVRVTPVLRKIIGDTKQKSSKKPFSTRRSLADFWRWRVPVVLITWRVAPFAFCWRMRSTNTQ
jgi:phage terminase large subunit GpA-like protein